ncbi:16S rRNA (uracil(1498)-N(3))-methyltransferase [bacterium]|nr:16S rRNA (uracil(1498)-N(3))-methyltransferase [bacterium]
MRARKSGEDEQFEELTTTALYVPAENISDGWLEFPDEELHHLTHVLRQGAGSRVQVLDGCGGVWSVLVERREGRLAGRVLEHEQATAPVPAISVALAPGRKERLRWAVEKLAELGAARIIPLLSAQVSFPGDPGRLPERLQPVCVAALKQSRQPFLTRVEPPLGFADFMKTCTAAEVQAVFCHKKTQTRAPIGRNRLGGARELVLVVGPEGGFDSAESGSILSSGLPCLDLGLSTLRFETAALAGFVLLRQMLRGDQGLY